MGNKSVFQKTLICFLLVFSLVFCFPFKTRAEYIDFELIGGSSYSLGSHYVLDDVKGIPFNFLFWTNIGDGQLTRLVFDVRLSYSSGTISDLRLVCQGEIYYPVEMKQGVYLFDFKTNSTSQYFSLIGTAIPDIDTSLSFSSLGQEIDIFSNGSITGDLDNLSPLYISSGGRHLGDATMADINGLGLTFLNTKIVESATAFVPALTFSANAKYVDYGNVEFLGGYFQRIDFPSTFAEQVYDKSVHDALTNQSTVIIQQGQATQGTITQQGEATQSVINQQTEQQKQYHDEEINEGNKQSSSASDMVEDLKGLKSKWAILWYPITWIQQMVDAISRTDAPTTLTFPSFALTVNGSSYTLWDSYTYDVASLTIQFKTLMDSLHVLISALEFYWFISFLRSKYMEIFGDKKED